MKRNQRGWLLFLLFFFVKGIGSATLGALAGLAPSFFQFAAFFTDKFSHSPISFT
jgi:hypothetical protein